MDRVLSGIRDISLKYPCIFKVMLFGSRARGDNTDKSDYDIAVFSENMSLQEQTGYKDDIEKINTLNKIDVVFIKPRHINTELYDNILKDGVEIMSKYESKLNNFEKAVARLHDSLNDPSKFSDLTFRDGVIQRFEFTAELAWKTAREYLLLEEFTDINSPKSVMREAYSIGLITDADGWLQILHDRNITSHVYDEEDADEIFDRIVNRHIILFDALLDRLKGEKQIKGGRS